MSSLDVRIRKRLVAFTLDVTARTSGHRLGIVGPSGSGKTTLLNCLAGVIEPDEGAILLDHRSLTDTSRGASNTPPHRRRIGYVFQDALLFPHMSVRQNLLYGARGDGGPRFDEVIRVLDIGSLLDRPADALSGGEARRAAIGRALLSGPRLLLLDEPMTGLDRASARRILTYLFRVLHTFDIPAVYVSHTVSDVIFLCDDAWVLREGRLQSQGPPRSVLAGNDWPIADELADLENLFMSLPEATMGDFEVFRVGDQRLQVGPQPVPVVGEAMLSVRADDIILAREKPGRLSARNVLRGRVTRVAYRQPYCLVFVNVGVEWMVTVTTSAVNDLKLTEGAEVYTIVKASAISVCAPPTDPVSSQGS